MNPRALRSFLLRTVFFSPFVNHGLVLMGPAVLLLAVSGELTQQGVVLAMYAVSLTHWWVAPVLAPPRCDDLSASRSPVNPSLLLLPLDAGDLYYAFARAHLTYCVATLTLLTGLLAMAGTAPSDAREITMTVPGGTVKAMEWFRTVQDGPNEVVQRHFVIAHPSLIFTPLAHVPLWPLLFGGYFLIVARITGTARFAQALRVSTRAWTARAVYGAHVALAALLVCDVLLPSTAVENILAKVAG